MTISEACERTGLTKKAIRHYESLGLISTKILPNGYRVYGQSEVSRLNQVALLSHLGFSLAEISEMLEAPDGDSGENCHPFRTKAATPAGVRSSLVAA